ncbi:hypothetical protein FF38_06912 [Lucilia cuprina]|uniref:Uncharacterized protein n=1 Tax=Lucilia cuprina TaxID=7375 RepID=A0A0L0BKP8_LUCCU|nr:hypothetical protein FF38_06912 [Lucilia cuprina]
MLCKACNRVAQPSEIEDCFEKAIDILKHHYTFYKNALKQRDLELQQIKERNEKLNKALQLLQTNQQQQPAKRYKSQHGDDSWLANNNSLQEEHVTSDLSLTDDEPIGASNLNMALNSEQLFETSALSQSKSDVSLPSSLEVLTSPRVKESPKRNHQRDIMRCFRDRNKPVERSKSEWNTKDRKSPAEKSWTMKFLQPEKVKSTEGKTNVEAKKLAVDKRLCLSLRKPNPSKVKQSLLNFDKSKDGSFRESDVGEDIIDASPVIVNKNSKAGRSWSHRSGHNHSNNNNSTTTNPLSNVATNKNNKDYKHDTNKTLDGIVFDFSPSKKTDATLELNSTKDLQPKQLKFDNEISTDCTALPNDPMSISTIKSDTSSVVILTPATQDIIFVDDCSDFEHEIDTMDLLASNDNLEKLKKYESKYIQKQQTKDVEAFKKPQDKLQCNKKIQSLNKIKQEKITQELKTDINSKRQEDKPSCSTSIKPQNPLLDELDTEDEEDFMPKPFIIKQETDVPSTTNKLTIKQRFNIDCEECEKLINFLDKGLSDEQIQQHLEKTHQRHLHDMMRQNTPKDFWNPFILSFQADDPRNEVLIDNRFKDKK